MIFCFVIQHAVIGSAFPCSALTISFSQSNFNVGCSITNASPPSLLLLPSVSPKEKITSPLIYLDSIDLKERTISIRFNASSPSQHRPTRISMHSSPLPS